MSDQNSLREDISYMRQLAETGRRGPILGGIFLAAAGIVFGLTCFLSWAGEQGILPIRGFSELYLWLGAFAVFGAVWLVVFLRIVARKASFSTTSNATFGTIWSACGAGVMVVFGTTMLIASLMHNTLVLAGYVPVVFAFYGTAWFASGAIAKRRWMHLAGAGSFVWAFVIAALSGSPLQTVAMGIGLLLLLTLPGIKLMVSETAP